MQSALLKGLLLLLLVFGLFLTSGCNFQAQPTVESSSSQSDAAVMPLTEKRKAELLNLSKRFVDLLRDEDYSVAVASYFAPALSQTMDATKLAQTWASLSRYGNLERYQDKDAQFNQSQGYDIVVLPLAMSRVILDMQFTINGQNQISGLYFKESPSSLLSSDEHALPAGVVEREMSFEAQKGYALNGTLTLPEQRSTALPAVVLVHGSGPQDRDESVGANHPFRDLADGLAEKGIGVLRYDKVTYAHAQALAGNAALMKEFTVDQETVFDAIGAVDWLKSQPEIDPNRVYLLGHSQGGMLASYIDDQGGDVAGLIIMAGSPRKLWEIIYDQNLALLETRREEGYDISLQLQMIDDERQRAESLAEMSPEEAAEMSFFGSQLQGHYLKHWESIDAVALLRASQKPAFILQGDRDFQVYADKDFTLWQEGLEGEEQVEYKLYPGLNHLFGHYEGVDAGTVAEYNHAQSVDPQVIDDIAEWIFKEK